MRTKKWIAAFVITVIGMLVVFMLIDAYGQDLNLTEGEPFLIFWEPVDVAGFEVYYQVRAVPRNGVPIELLPDLWQPDVIGQVSHTSDSLPAGKYRIEIYAYIVFQGDKFWSDPLRIQERVEITGIPAVPSPANGGVKLIN